MCKLIIEDMDEEAEEIRPEMVQAVITQMRQGYWCGIIGTISWRTE